MIVVGGEALVDLVPADSTVDGSLGALLPRLGGGPYNVAVAAGRLGAPVGFLSRVSEDAFGDALVERLHASNVDTELVARGPEPTTLAVTSMGPDGSARYTFYAEASADRLFADPGPLPERARMLSLGTLSLVLEPGASAYEAVLRREAARGVLTVLDPNVRPVLIADPDAYRARFASWLPDVALLKLSEEDARWLAGQDGVERTGAGCGRGSAPSSHGGQAGDLGEVLRAWRQAGPAVIVLTRGGAGLAVLLPTDEFVTVPAAPAHVVDTIGAGDTVLGALLAWLYGRGVHSASSLRALSAEDWRDALGYAGKAAAVTVSRAGAEPPYAAELPDPLGVTS